MKTFKDFNELKEYFNSLKNEINYLKNSLQKGNKPSCEKIQGLEFKDEILPNVFLEVEFKGICSCDLYQLQEHEINFLKFKVPQILENLLYINSLIYCDYDYFGLDTKISIEPTKIKILVQLTNLEY